jgi:hypothetical protein
MTLKQLKRKRLVIYKDELTCDLPGTPVLKGEEYEAFKLRIRRRDTDPGVGEVNFLIRELSNNLRFMLVYCFMDEPDRIHSISYWVNSKVLLPSGELAHAGNMIEEEKGSLLLMDFVERHLKKKYTFVSKDLQQY